MDQLTKIWMEFDLMVSGNRKVIGDYFQFILAKNEGAFLGMGSDLAYDRKIIFLIIIPLLVLFAVAYHTFTTKMDNLSAIGYGCIIGGGLSNIIDRMAYGEVVDFLFIKFSDTIKTGIFNLADVSVTLGVVMLIVAAIRNSVKDDVELV